MALVVGLCLCLLGLLGAYINKKWYNPMTLFCGLWSFICVLSSFRLYGMYTFSNRPYIIILIGFIGFCFGYLACLIKRRKIIIRFWRKKDYGRCEYFIDEKLLLICSAITTFFYAIITVRVLSIMSTGLSASAIRGLYFEASDMTYGSALFAQISAFIINPMMLALIPVNVIYFLQKMRLNIINILFLINLALYCTITFGRIIIVNTIVSLIIGTLIMGLSLEKEVKRKLIRTFIKYILPFCVILFVVIYNISNMRQSEKSDPILFGEQFYSYLTVVIPLMDNNLAYIDNNQYSTYGVIFLKGILNFLMAFGRKFGIRFPLFEQASSIIIHTEEYVPVFPGRVYNAFVSIFFAFYVDFREFGVFLGSAFYGWIMCKYFKEIHTKNIKAIAIYLWLMQSLVKSFFRWEFVRMDYCLAFIWLMIWIRKKYILSDNTQIDIG